MPLRFWIRLLETDFHRGVGFWHLRGLAGPIRAIARSSPLNLRPPSNCGRSRGTPNTTVTPASRKTLSALAAQKRTVVTPRRLCANSARNRPAVPLVLQSAANSSVPNQTDKQLTATQRQRTTRSKPKPKPSSPPPI